EVVLKEYNDFLTGERRLADILSGYLDPETDEDIPEVLEDVEELEEEDESSTKSTKEVKLDDDDEEEESEGDDDSEGDSGPDPEVAKVRFAELEA
ncbi:RNA polymerase sigma factor RpoD, partial [Klebsiella pneumoniae]|nr:RNA polymerase sigma factor RpoD [Klebsiella pneumoniae]